MSLRCWWHGGCELGAFTANDAGLLVATCHRCGRSRGVDLSDLTPPRVRYAGSVPEKVNVVPFRPKRRQR